MKEEFNSKMKKQAQEIEISLTEEQIDKFYQYSQLLIQWNEKMNLTAITKPEEIILKHFIYYLTIDKKL